MKNQQLWAYSVVMEAVTMDTISHWCPRCTIAVLKKATAFMFLLTVCFSTFMCLCIFVAIQLSWVCLCVCVYIYLCIFRFLGVKSFYYSLLCVRLLCVTLVVCSKPNLFCIIAITCLLICLEFPHIWLYMIGYLPQQA